MGEHRLALGDSVPTFRGRVLADMPSLNPAKVNSVGFLIADKRAGRSDWRLAGSKPRARDSCPTPTPKTNSSSGPPSGCSRSLAGPWQGHLPMPELQANREVYLLLKEEYRFRDGFRIDTSSWLSPRSWRRRCEPHGESRHARTARPTKGGQIISGCR